MIEDFINELDKYEVKRCLRCKRWKKTYPPKNSLRTAMIDWIDRKEFMPPTHTVGEHFLVIYVEKKDAHKEGVHIGFIFVNDSNQLENADTVSNDNLVDNYTHWIKVTCPVKKGI